MLDKYLDYKVDKLVSDYEDNRITLKNMKEQLKAMDGWGSGADGERVQSSPKPDSIDKLVIMRSELERKIAEYELLIANYERAWDKLSEEEQYILTQFFQVDQSTVSACMKIDNKFHRSKSPAYTIKNKALEHLRVLMFG